METELCEFRVEEQGNAKVEAPPTPVFTDVIVAVHGIGQQKRFETVRSVATRMAGVETLRARGLGEPVVPQPLGYFHSDVKRLTSVCLVDDLDVLKGMDLASIGFAEVFWADVPEDVVKEGNTLDETKAWARTVVARANALCKRAQADPANNWIVPPDFSLAGEVLDEIIDAVYVLENLTFLAKKAGLFNFNLQKVLVDYIGDVQLVTEFTYYRNEIVGRFHQAMESIRQQCSKANPKGVRIHIVAHSEGTVVSFLGMLQAMSLKRFTPGDPARNIDACVEDLTDIPDWLRHVHGFMTIGSPIDKHLLLWERLWTKLQPNLANTKLSPAQIRWRNYYDYGDPVGFELDSARLWLAHVKCSSFQFCGCKKCHHDIGFARYFLPGEAHNEYWNDGAVFEHFIREVVKTPTEQASPPPSRRYVLWFSPAVPYLLSFLLLAGGVFVLFKAVGDYEHPESDAFQRFVRLQELGIKVEPGLAGWELLRAVLGTTALIAGGSLLARFPRLAATSAWPEAILKRTLGKVGRLKNAMPRLQKSANQQGWVAVGILAFLIGCLAYVGLVPKDTQGEIGSGFSYLKRYYGWWGPSVGVLGTTAIAAMLGYLAMASWTGNKDRRQRVIFRGMRPLLLFGMIAIALVIILQQRPLKVSEFAPATAGVPGLSTNELRIATQSDLSARELRLAIQANPTNWSQTLERVGPALSVHPKVWPVLLAGAAFLYLWWLSMLVFDLTFVWHRYIRHSTTNTRLREWNPYGFSRRPAPGDDEPCCNPERLQNSAR